MKQVFIINGSGGVGKDSFVKLVGKAMDIWYSLYGEQNRETIHGLFTPCGCDIDPYNFVWNYSSVHKVKDIAQCYGGWRGGKTEKDRKFLSDLKLLFTDYNDMPFESMKEVVKEFKKDKDAMILFLHIREPEEIARARREFNAITVLVTRNSVPQIHSNMADNNVLKYKYDITINNSGSKRQLFEEAWKFVYNFIHGVFYCNNVPKIKVESPIFNLLPYESPMFSDS